MKDRRTVKLYMYEKQEKIKIAKELMILWLDF